MSLFIDYLETSTNAKFPQLLQLAQSKFNILKDMQENRFYKNHLTFTEAPLHSFSYAPRSKKTPYYYFNFNTKHLGFVVPVSDNITLTRCDVAFDFSLTFPNDPETCPNFQLQKKLAQSFGLANTLSYQNKSDGSITEYYGKRGNNLYIRVYTKPDLSKTRLELEFRPRNSKGKISTRQFFQDFLPQKLSILPKHLQYFSYPFSRIFPDILCVPRGTILSNTEISQLARFSHLASSESLKYFMRDFSEIDEFVYSEYIKYYQDDMFKALDPQAKK